MSMLSMNVNYCKQHKKGKEKNIRPVFQTEQSLIIVRREKHKTQLTSSVISYVVLFSLFNF